MTLATGLNTSIATIAPLSVRGEPGKVVMTVSPRAANGSPGSEAAGPPRSLPGHRYAPAPAPRPPPPPAADPPAGRAGRADRRGSPPASSASSWLPISDLRRGERFFDLGVLAPGRPQEVAHAHRLAFVGGQEGGVERDVADVASSYTEAGEELRLQSLDRRLFREDAAPDLLPLRRFGERELDDEAEAAQERRVERVLEVRGEDREPAVGLHALEQIADLDVGVAVVAVLDLGTFAEQGVGLVEEEDGPAFLGGVEHLAQVLLGLADVLADHGREVDAEEVEPELAGEDLGGHGLAGAAGAGEQGAHPQAARGAGGEAPVVIDPGAPADVDRDLGEDLALRLGEHQVVPGGGGADALGEGFETRPGVPQTGVPEDRKS